MPARIVVLASGSGSTLQSILDDPQLRPLVVAAGTDVPGCAAMSRARAAGVETFARALIEYDDRDAWNDALAEAVAGHHPDLVVLAGFMRILSPKTVGRFRIVNTHPALLPAFPGAHAVRDALAAGATTTGVTVHWVDDGVDTGPVITQVEVPVRPDDNETSLRERIQAVEKPLYRKTILELATEFGMNKIAVRRALISVYDKTGLDEFARGLHEAGVEIVSTGSTAARIRDLGVPVTPVDDVTGFPEILGGRVKTLHPHVHAGLLADQSNADHVATIEELGIASFQMLVSNLYPFTETVASGASQQEVLEQIDIGGPAMVRASAKNHGSIAVVTDPARYGEALEAVRTGGFDLATRQRLALAAFRQTAAYDIAVASWLGNVVAPDDEIDGESTGFPAWIAAYYERAGQLRYGENPHQSAALYIVPGQSGGIAQAEQLSGKEMSFNNYVDSDAAWRAAYDFAEPCVAIVKHANPCGIAVSADIADAHLKAHACDPTSAFGGVIATNRAVSMAMAEQLADIFTEVIVAPSFDADALEKLSRKKNLRLLVAQARPDHAVVERRQISGGLLLQTSDVIDAVGDDPSSWTLAAGDPADEATLADLAFAWRAVRAVKSNAILLAADRATVGIGMGQVNRVDSCKLAVARAGDRAAGSVAASDAYFPFSDGPQVLLDAGIRAIVEPGGSIRDEETIAAVKQAGITLYLTGTRHFAH